MRWIIVAALLVGCTEEEAWMQEVGDASYFLVDDAAEQFPDRARVAVQGDARFAPGMPVFAGEGSPIRRDLVVVDPGRDIRVVHDTGRIQMLVYLPRYDLQDVIWKPTFSTIGPEGGTSGVLLPAGLDVEPDDDRGGFLFRGENETIIVETWLPDEAVDQWWTLPIQPAIRPRRSGERYELPGEAEILYRPFGDAFAWIQPFTEDYPDAQWVSAYGTGAEEDGHIEVIIDADGWEVRGWVLRPGPIVGGFGKGGCISCGGGCGWGYGGSYYLPVGTPLSAEPWGDQVARVTNRPWPVIWTEDAIELEELTAWGTAVLYADPLDMVAGGGLD